MDGLLNILGQAFQWILNSLIEIFNYFSHLVESLLPQSPFRVISGYVGEIPWLGVLNYFVPVAAMLDIFLVWAGVMLVYFVVAVILRWLKIVR